MDIMLESMLSNIINLIPWWFYAVALLSIVVPILFGNPNHWPRVLGSYLALKKFIAIGEDQGPAEQFRYLRARDPFLFEEMILTALKKAGYRIRRNRRYTGDGGVDGQCWIDKEHYLIQAKRYSHHINAVDVKEFYQLCKSKGKKGLFIHTGKTGKASWRQTKDVVFIVSGDRMLSLLGGQWNGTFGLE